MKLELEMANRQDLIAVEVSEALDMQRLNALTFAAVLVILNAPMRILRSYLR